ncbi:MAG: archaeosine biosynthesis radical SAM protein RaSEA [Euryarchaeota archaeon]|nr:archaeosine biosynthesis radical SAM protein RaSEA [Euryarchaeota archaeon]
MRKDEINLSSPVAVWKSQELCDGKVVPTLVVILRTCGCAWSRTSGCTMCGYDAESVSNVSEEDLDAQVARALSAHNSEPVVKIYTSGSFLDLREIPRPAEVFQRFLDKGAQRIVVESRPEYVETSLPLLEKSGRKVEVAMGLETASDKIRSLSINKGFTFGQYAIAAKGIKKAGARVRTYLLLKPPFLNERDAIEDCSRSIDAAAKMSDVISINPVNVQRGTLVERMWKRGEYRPPWLWSLLEALRRGHAAIPKDVMLVSDPSGGGTPRGVHNCGKCDGRVLEAVKRISLSQDAGALSIESCACRQSWEAMLDVEPAAMTTIDLARHVREGSPDAEDD